MPAPAKKVQRKGTKAKVYRSRERLPATAPRLSERKRAKRQAAATAAQKEFLDDMRVSLEEVQRGELIPADEVHKLLALELDDDEFDRRLHAAVRKEAP